MLLLVSRLGGAQPLQRFADGLVNDRWGQDISLEGYQDLTVGSFHGCFETVGTHRDPTRVVILAGVRVCSSSRSVSGGARSRLAVDSPRRGAARGPRSDGPLLGCAVAPVAVAGLGELL